MIIRILYAGTSSQLIISSTKTNKDGVIQYGLNNNDLVQFIGFIDSCEEAIKLTKSQQPDIVLIDAHIDGVGSIEATKRIRKLKHNPAVVGISTVDDPIYPYYFFNAGAQGFIHANDQMSDFLKAVQTVIQGRIYQSALTNAQI